MAIDYTKRKAPAADVAATPDKPTPTKVTLTKGSPNVSLSKQSGRLQVNLNWDARPPQAKQGGFLKRLAASRGIDLDLGCLYELADGTKGVVQALGNAFGQLDAAPYILLNGDDRSGANSGGEDCSSTSPTPPRSVASWFSRASTRVHPASTRPTAW